MLGWRCIPESIINSSHDLKPFAVSVSLQQQDVTQHDNNEEHRITPKNGKSIYCGCYFFGKQKCRPFAVVGHVINVLKTRKQFAFRKFATAAENCKGLYGENNSCHPVTLEWFSIQILVNLETFKLSLKFFP